MKAFFAVIILVFVYTAVSAQAGNQPGIVVSAPTVGQPGKDQIIRICTPSRADMLNHQPLWVLFLNNKQVYKGNAALSNIDPNNIQSLIILKDSSAVKKYGNAAQNGVVEVYFKDGAKVDTTKFKAEPVKKS